MSDTVSELRWALCLVLHGTWDLAGSPVGRRQDSVASGQSNSRAESQRSPWMFQEKEQSVFYAKMFDFLEDRKPPLRRKHWVRWGQNQEWVRLRHQAGLLSLRGCGPSESGPGSVAGAPAQGAGNALSPTPSGKVENTLLPMSLRKWCLLIRPGSWGGKCLPAARVSRFTHTSLPM